MTTLVFANNARTTLADPVASTDTTATLAAGTGGIFPALTGDQAFKMTFNDALTGLLNEIVLVTARSGDVLTIQRGQENTTPRNWIAGDYASNYETAGTEASLVQATQLQAGYYDVASVGGTGNTITGTIPSTLSAIPDNMELRFSATAENTGAVTLQLTIGSTLTAAIPVIKYANSSLVAGDIPSVGYPVMLLFDAHATKWIMTNPATQASGTGTVTGGENAGTGVDIFLPGESSASTLAFNVLANTGNVTFTDNNDGTVSADATVDYSDIQNVPANLTELANLVLTANAALVSNGSDVLAEVALAANTFLARASTGDISAQAVTDFSLSLLSQTSAANWRTALGLGTAAVLASDNDPTMSSNSATRLPTQQAVVGYVTSAISHIFKLIGNYDASGNVFPSTGGSGAGGAILEGNLWIISVAGTLGTHAVSVGDMIVAATDTPGQTQANWAFIEGGLGYIPQQQSAALTQISTAGSATANTFWARASTGNLSLKSITDAVLGFLGSITGFTGTGTTGVLANSPTLTTPNLGVPSAIDLTNASGTAANVSIGGNAATATSAGTATTATNANNVAMAADATNATRYIPFVAAATGNQAELTNTSLNFNPSTGTLASPVFSGAGTSLTGTAASLNIGGTAAKATNLAGGTANQISYQTGANTTAFANGSLPVNAQTGTTYTLVLTDAPTPLYQGAVTMNNAAANTLTVPPNASVAFPVGTQVQITQLGVGQTTIVAGAGVTINAASSLLARTQMSVLVLTQLSANSWTLSGDMQ